MDIRGLNKTTLLDYPEHVAATIFTGGCNFRCPFCHNGNLVLNPKSVPAFSVNDVLTFLNKRKHILSGICITGGEPTLQPDLTDFMKSVKDIGYLVKLDTNGYHPDVLKRILEAGLVDYVAMDLKAGLSHYAQACGLEHFDSNRILESISLLSSSLVAYEFRTTTVKGIHTTDDFIELSQIIPPDASYFIQSYKESDGVIHKGYSSFTAKELSTFLAIIQPHVPAVALRGVD